MRKPENPPDFADILSDPQIFERLQPLIQQAGADENYLHWDKIRRLRPPQGFTSREWWTAIKIARLSKFRTLSLKDSYGHPFRFSTPDSIQRFLHQSDLSLGGQIDVPQEILNPETRNRYLVSSLIQEAITSSQLEGAVTTREIAKAMLLSGRKPRDESEQMILNNYRTMSRIQTLRNEPLSESLVLSLHANVTEGTLKSPDMAGRYRLPTEDICVADIEGEVFHVPPAASQLPERMQAMCDFANVVTPRGFIHPVIRAIILHFWLAYDHPFVDGNGRTARALFYWAMLRQGYWLFEFISISDILRQAPAKYARAFLYSETDDNDLTYFIVHQAQVIQRAVQALHDYIAHKTAEIHAAEGVLRDVEHFNHRQITLLSHALRHPGTLYTIEGHQRSHNTVYETARRDLTLLAEADVLVEVKRGRKKTFRAPADLQERIEKYVRIRRQLDDL